MAYTVEIDVENIAELFNNKADKDLGNTVDIIKKQNFKNGIETDTASATAIPSASNSLTETTVSTVGWVNDPAKSTNVVHRTGDESIAGTKTFTGTAKFNNVIQGTALKAQWADLAEVYKTDNEYPIGTLVQFGGEKEFTIATNNANAIISEKPAYLMNSEMIGQPIAMIGRVKVRTIGKVNRFDLLYLSEIDGVASTIAKNAEQKPIARALEDKNADEEGLVLSVVMFNLV